MDAVAIEYLRGEIKRCELLAERLQQEMMEQRYPADKTGLPASVLDATTANINAYDALISATSEALPQPVVDSLLQIFGATYAA